MWGKNNSIYLVLRVDKDNYGLTQCFTVNARSLTGKHCVSPKLSTLKIREDNFVDFIMRLHVRRYQGTKVFTLLPNATIHHRRPWEGN